MNVYEPRNGLAQKLDRRIRRFRNTRMLDVTTQTSIVSITFDDFPKTAATVGAPKLEAKGWNATYYVSAMLENTVNHHGQQFDRDDILRLDGAGHEIAGHTSDHSDLTQISPDDVVSQIQSNKERLLSYGLTQNIDNFAYPYGAASSRLKSSLSHEFKSMRGVRGQMHYGRADLNELYSFGFYSSTRQSVIDTVHSLKHTPGWMTLFTHDIQETPTQWGCTAQDFDALLDAIKASGARVMTIRQALEHFGDLHD